MANYTRIGIAKKLIRAFKELDRALMRYSANPDLFSKRERDMALSVGYCSALNSLVNNPVEEPVILNADIDEIRKGIRIFNKYFDKWNEKGREAERAEAGYISPVQSSQ
ncbi:MAG: hypothetical protein HYX24_01650 [Candidatus Aenigmarchaeota archaeon]|nr:hypothetical protein [Candidatus Aenigmarchaeota archaeon]